MSDDGYIEVEVRDVRFRSTAGGLARERRVTACEFVTIEDSVADMILAGAPRLSTPIYESSVAIRSAISNVRRTAVEDQLRVRWEAAIKGVSAEKMRAALAILEAPEVSV